MSAVAVESTLGVTAVAAFIAAGATASLGRNGLADGCTTIALAATGFLGVRGLVGDRRQRRAAHDEPRHERRRDRRRDQRRGTARHDGQDG